MAVAWTAIGLLAATLFGSLFYLGERIDALGAKIDSRIDGLSARIDGLSARTDGLGGRIDAHLDRHVANRSVDTVWGTGSVASSRGG